MKVFLSWSGVKSHRIAKVFKDWLPSVVQSILPYVSSEDIDKGARWSTDIAKELEDSSFGILCVTKDNINAPWLTFEAGALSKTIDKSFVCPFLFDIKRSEIDGPILQFQSTIFQKDDINKLLKTLNKACGKDKLSDRMLEKAFDVWYPTLEKELNKIKKISPEPSTNSKSKKEETIKGEILEEILDLSRINQKLLRSPDRTYLSSIKEVKENFQEIIHRMETIPSFRVSRKIRHPILLEELFHLSSKLKSKYLVLHILLSLFRDDFPWIYDAGKEVIDVIKSNKTKNEKRIAVEDFMRMIEITIEHPIIRDLFVINKEYRMIIRECGMLLSKIFREYV